MQNIVLVIDKVYYIFNFFGQKGKLKKICMHISTFYWDGQGYLVKRNIARNMSFLLNAHMIPHL